MNDNIRTEPQSGQSLITILILGAVLAILGYAMVAVLRMEMRLSAKSKVTDANFSGGDSALQRAMAKLLERDSSGNYNSWTNISRTAGFASLTFTVAVPNTLTNTGYNDIPGLQYYIKIIDGDRYPSALTYSAKDDTEVELWGNQGDILSDRTIVVRTINLTSGRQGVTYNAYVEDRYYTVVHRNDPPAYVPGPDAMNTCGEMLLGNTWSADCFNSCNGNGIYGGGGGGCGGAPFPTPVGSPCVPSCPDDSLTAGGTIAGGGSGFGTYQQQGSAGCASIVLVAPSLATSTASTTVLVSPSGATITANTTIGPASSAAGIDFKCWAIDLGNNTLTVDISGGPVRLWVMGTKTQGAATFAVRIGGNGGIVTSGTNPYSCCKARAFTMYVMDDDSACTRVGADCAHSNSCGANNKASVQYSGTSGSSWFLVVPKGTFELGGGGGGLFMGGIVARLVCVNAGGSNKFIYDQCLKAGTQADAYKKPPLITTSWKQFLRDK